MAAYPTEVELNEENIEKFIALFKDAYKELLGLFLNSSDFQMKRRRMIKLQIERILEQLGVDVQKWLMDELPQYYRMGANEAIRQLELIDANVRVGTNFSQIHKMAMFALVDDAGEAIATSIRGVGRSGLRLLNEAVKQEITLRIAKGRILGDDRRAISKAIKGILQQEGLASLVDKGGHSWTLDRYARMLVRTKAVESRNRGFANRMVENGYDLVIVSNHPGSCDLCAPWQGKVLSLSGKTPGVPRFEDALKSGLFHPNCKHAINAFDAELAKLTKAYDNRSKTYVPTEYILQNRT